MAGLFSNLSRLQQQRLQQQRLQRLQRLQQQSRTPKPNIQVKQKITPITGSSEDYPKKYILANRFYVEIESQLTAWFSSCQGLSVKNETTLLAEGGLLNQQRVLLGPAKFTEVTLTRGMTDNLMFWQWLQQTFNGGSRLRRTVNILTFNQAGATMQCWTLVGAVPVSWKTPQLQASSTSVAIEEMTLAFEGLRMSSRSGGGGAAMHNGRDKLGFFG